MASWKGNNTGYGVGDLLIRVIHHLLTGMILQVLMINSWKTHASKGREGGLNLNSTSVLTVNSDIPVLPDIKLRSSEGLPKRMLMPTGTITHKIILYHNMLQ